MDSSELRDAYGVICRIIATDEVDRLRGDRARIVAWLRGKVAPQNAKLQHEMIADAIEQGKHEEDA